MAKKKIEFQPIPGAKNGYTCLDIYPPGTWMDNPDYVVFVGGCGIGRAKTEKAAKEFLLEGAKIYCKRLIAATAAIHAEARHQLEHYERQLSELEQDGLRPKK